MNLKNDARNVSPINLNMKQMAKIISPKARFLEKKFESEIIFNFDAIMITLFYFYVYL